jgi:hypothetical protein
LIGEKVLFCEENKMKMRNNEAVNVTDDDDIEVFEEFILQSR